ncbi:hypothetical protein [Escherichia coli]|uniref:hypothetical protein n=1 Tax=Escherichia coli TaxID=562 RepID=UPI0020230D96|nr:hypothetical protein [Escherichia coli]
MKHQNMGKSMKERWTLICAVKIEEEGYSVFVAFYDFIKNMAVYMAFIQLTKTPL